MLFQVDSLWPKLAPQLAQLTARVVRVHGPHSAIALRTGTLEPRLDFAGIIALNTDQSRGDILITRPSEPLEKAVRAHPPRFIVLTALTRAEDRQLRSGDLKVAGYELREIFYFGFLLLPFLWLKWLPLADRFFSALLSLEIRLHPYLNVLAGIGTVAVLSEKRRDAKSAIDLSIVIPAYNESGRLPAYLAEISRFMKARRIAHEIIVADDGSRDGTGELVRKMFRGVRVIRLYQNFGKGAAVREGVMAAKGRQVLIADADGATPITEYPKLAAEMENGADAAIGSRYLAQSEIGKRQNLMRRMVSRAGNLLIRSLLDLPYKDTQCGFKLFDRKAAQYLFRNLSNFRFGFDFEILKKAGVLRLSVSEVAVRWNDQDGSKVTFKQTIRVLTELLKLRFGHLIKFAFVGVINTVADFTVHNLLIVFFGIGEPTRQLVYMVVAFFCANLLAFTLHSGFTFQRRAAYRRFFTVSVFTLLVAGIIFHGLNLLYNPEADVLLTNIFKLSTVIISFITNYFGYKFWVYRYNI